MALKFSEAVRNARLDAIETAVGAAPILEIRSGAAPASIGDADSGTLLASMTLPADWLAAAAGGSKSMSGTWEDASGDADGVAGHFRIKNSAGTTTHMQGSITSTGGGGDMTLSNTSVATAQAVSITTFTLTDGNA